MSVREKERACVSEATLVLLSKKLSRNRDGNSSNGNNTTLFSIINLTQVLENSLSSSKNNSNSKCGNNSNDDDDDEATQVFACLFVCRIAFQLLLLLLSM